MGFTVNSNSFNIVWFFAQNLKESNTKNNNSNTKMFDFTNQFIENLLKTSVKHFVNSNKIYILIIFLFIFYDAINIAKTISLVIFLKIAIEINVHSTLIA